MRSVRGDRSGFALLLVVLLLFAIAVAGATGYQVVSSEFAMSTHSREGVQALAVARAGLQRFVAEQAGVVGDSVSYAIGDGIATVTTRKLYEEDDQNHLYYVRSEGTVLDIRTPDTQARRVVGAYAWHRMNPIEHRAAVMASANIVRIRSGGDVNGLDQSTALDCAEGGLTDITGAIALSNVQVQGGGTLNGSPNSETYPSFAAMYDSVSLRWDILSDASFPVEFDGSPPDFGALPSDSFPLVRYIGNLNAGNSWSGRGTLIVTGELDMTGGFSWSGLILAGAVDSQVQGQVDGMVIAGLNGTNPASTVQWRGKAYYHACNVYSAAEALSHLELVDNTTFEAN